MSNTNLVILLIAGLVNIIDTLLLVIYLKNRFKLSIKPILIGMFIFCFFSLILEGGLNLLIIKLFPTFTSMSLPFATYAALVAGIFEESGRYIAYKYILPKFRDWKDGLAYGLGHGGIESILLGGFQKLILVLTSITLSTVNISNLILKSPSSLKKIELLKYTLSHITASSQMLSIFERVNALSLQIGLSILVLYSIKVKKIRYLILAILIHMIVDFLPALFQVRIIKSPFIVELFLFILSIVSLIWIIQSKKIFKKFS